jgi:cytochrome P450
VVRIVQRDAEIDGRLYAAGTRILFNLLAASRDPEKFPDPDRFDPARGADDSRLPFGWGVHRCLGQPLARLLIEEGLRAMTERITEVHADADSAGPHPSEMLGGPTSLPMTFRPRTA